jgi:D-alanyl-D-alanine dipeptidase
MTADAETSNDARATALAAHFETEIVRRVFDPVARAAALTVLSREWWHAVAGDDADHVGDRPELAEP